MRFFDSFVIGYDSELAGQTIMPSSLVNSDCWGFGLIGFFLMVIVFEYALYV